MSQFYDFGIYYTWQVTQLFTGKLHLTKCTLFKVIQRFIIILRFCRRIRHICDVRMAAKWRKLANFASFCTLQVTKSTTIVFIHAKLVLHEPFKYVLMIEVVPIIHDVVMTSYMSEKCRKFMILAFIKLVKWLDDFTESRIPVNVLYLGWHNVLSCFGVIVDTYGISMTSKFRQN